MEEQFLDDAQNVNTENVEKDYILEVDGLKQYFPVATNFFGKPLAYLRAVDGVSFKLERGRTLGVVGESGCGKSVTSMSVMRLLQGPQGQIFSGSIRFKAYDYKKDAAGNLISVDDNAICIYEMSGGAFGTMTASWTYYGAEDNSTVLYGTKGIMRIYDDPAAAIKVILADGGKISYDVEAIQTNDNQTKSGVIDLWMESLVNDTAPEISGKSALAAMRAVFASIESSETGKAVDIPENR